MQAITVIPLQAGSARVDEVGEPPPKEGELPVQTLAVGVCGTDLEISQGEYGWAPPGRERLVLGHESLGRVLDAPAGSDLAAGDLVVLVADLDATYHRNPGRRRGARRRRGGVHGRR